MTRYRSVLVLAVLASLALGAALPSLFSAMRSRVAPDRQSEAIRARARRRRSPAFRRSDRSLQDRDGDGRPWRRYAPDHGACRHQTRSGQNRARRRQGRRRRRRDAQAPWRPGRARRNHRDYRLPRSGRSEKRVSRRIGEFRSAECAFSTRKRTVREEDHRRAAVSEGQNRLHGSQSEARSCAAEARRAGHERAGDRRPALSADRRSSPQGDPRADLRARHRASGQRRTAGRRRGSGQGALRHLRSLCRRGRTRRARRRSRPVARGPGGPDFRTPKDAPSRARSPTSMR